MRRYFNKPEKEPGPSSRSKRLKFKQDVKSQNIEIKNLVYSSKFMEQDGSAQEDAKTEEKSLVPVSKEKLEQYSRGEPLQLSSIKNKILKKKLEDKDVKFEKAAEQAARAELLLTEQSGYLIPEDGERTTRVSQSQLQKCVDITSATKHFDLHLNFGPYRVNYLRNGRHLLLGGQKGHVAAFDWVTKKLHCEMNVMEEVFDIKWLHVETMFAVAQKKWVYIYDKDGIEIHCLKELYNVLRMEFLPYHFLLVCGSENGYLSWLDVSTGSFVSHFNTKLGRLKIMTQNPYNAIICTGHTKGTVCMWSPNVREPVAKMLCHRTALSAVAIDPKGLYMATSDVDRVLNIWDIRNLNGPLQHYKLHSVPSNLTFSQKGFLGVALGNVVEVYNSCCSETAKYPYMRHRLYKTVGNIQFCPYEDVLGVGRYGGFTSLLIPGSGEPNIDALECNPFQTKKQRQEAEVKALLEKIQPEMITLDPFDIIEVDVPTLKERIEARNSLMHLKPTKVDFTPRRKKRKVNEAKVKQIVKEQNKKEFLKTVESVKEKLQNDEEAVADDEPAKYNVFDRFIPKKKKNK